MATTRKEIAKSIKTLIVLLKPLKGQEVTITLRNDSIVKGTIENVDSEMNIEMSKATLAMDPFYCIKPQENSNRESTSKLEGEEVKEEELEVPKEQQNAAGNVDLPHGADGYDSDDDTTDTNEDHFSLDYFVVKGSRIRHIDLPTDCDLLEGARCEIERIRNRGKQWTKRDIVVRSEADRRC